MVASCAIHHLSLKGMMLRCEIAPTPRERVLAQVLYQRKHDCGSHCEHVAVRR
jgi:hypothetical protein